MEVDKIIIPYDLYSTEKLPYFAVSIFSGIGSGLGLTCFEYSKLVSISRIYLFILLL